MAEETPTPGGPADGSQDGPEGEEPETRPAGGAADADRDGAGDVPMMESDAIQEETEAKQGVASITAKLSALADAAGAEKRETAEALAELDLRISALREFEKELRASVEAEIATYNKASGKSDGKAEAFNELAGELERDDAGGAVAELRRLIEFERNAILTAAKKLVGDTPAHAEYLAVFLDETTNPGLVTDEGRAGGLAFEKKQRAVRITGLEQAYQALIKTKGMLVVNRDHEIIEARKKLDDAKFDQNTCEQETIALCQEIFNARATIADLARSIKKASTFADGIRSRAEGVEDTSDSSAIDTARQALEANAEPIKEATEARAKLVEKERSATELENACTKLIMEQERVLAALSAAEPLVAGAVKGGDLYNRMIGELGTDLEKYEKSVLEPINLSDTVIIKPHVLANFAVIKTTIWMRVGSMCKALVRAGERLKKLAGALSEGIKTANASDPIQLSNVEAMLTAAEEVQRFIREEWPELEAGNREKINAISKEVQRAIKGVLGPLEPLADFLRAGPDEYEWAELRRLQAGKAMPTERVVTAEEEAAMAKVTAKLEMQSGSGAKAEGEGTAESGDDGTGSVATPRDPLPAVEKAADVGGGADAGAEEEADTKAEDDVDVDVSDAVDAADGAASDPEVTAVTPDAPAVEVKPVATTEEQPAATGTPRRRTTKK